MNSAFQIQSIENSIQNLIKSWNRRQKWLHLMNYDPKLAQERASWRTLLSNFLESTSLKILTISLLLVDLILTSLELSSSLLSCQKTPKNTSEEDWYHWVGIVILSLLCVKSLALLIGLGKSFFCRPGYVLDGLVLMVALLLEAFFDRKGGGLVVVVSLWRVLRVVECAFELCDEAIEAQIDIIVFQFETLRNENTRLAQIIVENDLIIEKLQEEIYIAKLDK